METVDLRGLTAARWQSHLLSAFAALSDGDLVRLVADDDPIHVWQWLEGLQPGRFTWEYRRRGGEWWVEVGLPFRSSAEACVCRRAS